MSNPAGYLHCPNCFQRRLFHVAEHAAPSDPQPPLECGTCFYLFAKADVQTPGEPNRKVDMLGEELRAEAMRQYTADFSRSLANNGYRLRPIDIKILNK